MTKTEGTKYPNIVHLDRIDRSVARQIEGGRWVVARPLGYASLVNRIRCAWLVFTGQADALIWPEDEKRYADAILAARETSHDL